MSRAFDFEDEAVVTKPKATVRYSSGRTINMGNFESVRFDITIELECDSTAVSQTYNKVKRLVDDKVTTEEERYRDEA